MAYLLPVVHMLKQLEGEEGYMRRAKRPKIVVLGPTKELTEQVSRLSEPTADMQQLVSSEEHILAAKAQSSSFEPEQHART